WEIFAELYGRLNKASCAFSKVDIFNEINELTSLYAEADFLDDDRHTCLLKLPQVADQDFSYQLITADNGADGLQLLTGTSAGHFGTTSTWAPAPLEVEPEGVLKVNAEDAKVAGIADGDKLKLTSTIGSTIGKVLISESVPQGLIFAPNNFTSLGIQQLMPDGDNLTSVQMAKA
ncbi:MAG: molybdopterin dinucleotide binding domain-containing protein, partial [Desulfuromusa sp.]|nr:molybdopterin dinucleotide binding domain-containing protein [Desulfuromusa sp.]